MIVWAWLKNMEGKEDENNTNRKMSDYNPMYV